MALPKKRKIDDEEASGICSQEGTLSSHQLRRIAKKFKNQRTAGNLLMKLPGELRNIIYNLVLVKDKVVVIRGRKFKTQRPHNFKYRFHVTRRRWREPELLRVSKQIRKETTLMYYLSHRFAIFTTTHQINDVRIWLGRICQQIDSKDGISFHLYLSSSSWGDIVDWISLAKLAYENDLKLISSSDQLRPWNPNIISQAITITDQSHRHVAAAVKEVVELGTNARQQDFDYEGRKWDARYKKLRAGFEGWVAARDLTATSISRRQWNAAVKLWEDSKKPKIPERLGKKRMKALNKKCKRSRDEVG